VDIINKKEVVFTTGSIYKAIRASVAIPTVLTPIRTEEGLLVDGGVMNNIPINHVKRTHDDLLIVVDVNAEVPVLKPPKTEEENKTMLHIYHKKILAFYNQFQPESQQSADEKFGYFDLLNHTIGFMTHQIAMQKLEKHPPDLVINISNQICNAFDFYKAEELIEIGRYVTQKRMEDHE
jgi:NTE family protein